MDGLDLPPLDGLLGDVADDGRWLPVAVVVALLLALRALRGRGGKPRPGEIWFAAVPFEDGTGSKDRPVLVLSVDGGTCTVAQFTSQDQGERRDHAMVPPGTPGLTKESWISLHPLPLRRSAMRRRAGTPGLPLVEWYDARRGRP